MEKLAIHGAEPTRREPIAPWPSYSEEVIDRVAQVLRSGKVNYWTGDECRAFEAEFAEFHGCNYGIGLANGTLALELALRILNIGAGDEVIVTPRSYFASVSSVVLAGAVPVFADVCSESQNITADSIAAKISKRTKAILPVHLAGWPCDMPAIMTLAKEHGLLVIEDCAQAHGAAVNGQRAGSFGDAAAFSFCQDKIMTTGGEGGILLLQDEELWRSAWSFKDHGKSLAEVQRVDHPPGFRWLHETIGTNWRITEMQAAIGRYQLGVLPQWLEQRANNAARYNESFAELPALRVPRVPHGVQHAFYKYYMFIDRGKLKSNWSRDKILQALVAEGVPGLSGSCPEIYKEKSLAYLGAETLVAAKKLGETSIMLPVHPTLTDNDVSDIIAAVKKVIDYASL